MDPRPYHHGDLREALIAAGLSLLEEGGLAALTLRAIAARVGVSHAAPRRHFSSLKALHTAIAAEGFWRHAAATQAGPGSDRAARLRAAVEGYVGFAAANPALFALMFSPAHADFSDPELASASAASYAVLAAISRGLDWPGAAGPGRQERTEQMLWSLLHGYATLTGAGLLGAPGEGPHVAAPILTVMPAFRYEDPAIG